MPRPYNTTLTREQRVAKARKAALASNTIDAYIKRIVNRAPELTDAQRDRLAALIRPSGGQ